MNSIIKVLILLSFSVIHQTAAQLSVSDCPAAPYAIEITQPDNSRIKVVGKGSFLNNHVETEDGYTIVKNAQGIYEYAHLEGNKLISSGTMVADGSKKSTSVSEFLSKQPKHLSPKVDKTSTFNVYNSKSSDADEEMINRAFPTSGTRKVLVLLIDYPDLVATNTPADFTNFMNQVDYNSTGSVRDFYLKASDNTLTVDATVVGWYRAANNSTYYGQNQGYDKSRELVREAVDAANLRGVDFSIYDNDNDGYVDGVIVVHSGQGAEEGSQTQYVWSHRWTLGSSYDRVYDDVTINDYMMNPERRIYSNGGLGGMVGVGVFIHEFGHGFGLPDLYDTDNTTPGISSWCIMGSANWLGDEKVPGFMSAWSRAELNWVTPIALTNGTYSLNASTASTTVYKATTADANEYFLFENRQQTGQDAYLKGDGLAIWHIDDNKSNNTDETHRLVDLEQADGLYELNGFNGGGDADDGDLFPGSTARTSFLEESTSPNSDTYANANSRIEITNITEADGVISFTFSSLTIPTITNVTSATADGSYKQGDLIALTVSFSEVVNVTGTPQLTLETGGTDAVVNYTSGTGTNTLTFNYTIGAGETSSDLDYVATNSLALNGGAIKDGALNDATLTLAAPGAANSLGANKALIVDGILPTMVITASNGVNTIVDGTTTGDASILLTFTSSEATSDFLEADITVTGGTLSSFNSTSSTVYTAIFTPSVLGATTIDVSGGTFTDAAGNANTAETQFNWRYDTVVPAIIITATNGAQVVADGAITNDGAIIVTFTISEATSNFEVGDIIASGGTISDFVANSSTVYIARFTPSSVGETTIDVAAGAFTDVGGYNNTAAAQFNWTYQNTPPTMTITATNGTSNVADGATTNDGTLIITFTSSEVTTNFGVDDIMIKGAILSNFSGASGAVYTATFTPLVAGATTIDIVAGAYTDVVGNNNIAAAQFNWTYDNISPTATIIVSNSKGIVTTGAIGNEASLSVTFKSNEPTTDFAIGDITVTNGVISAFAAKSSTVYNATLTPSGEGVATIGVAAGSFNDIANNKNSSAAFNWTYDITSPTVIITATNGESVVSDGGMTNNENLTLTFNTSEATADFKVSDITVSGGIISNFIETSSRIYTATFTPSTQGATTIDVAAGTFIDAGGNNNTVATQFNWTYENTRPKMIITATNGTGNVADGATSNDEMLIVTFISSEATSNFVAEDVIVSGGTISAFNSTSSTVYTATFTPSTSGITSLDVVARVFTDAAGNDNTSSGQFNWIYDGTSPTLTITAISGSNTVLDGANTSDQALTIIFTSSEATTTFSASDITTKGGALSDFVAKSSTVYMATFTPTALGATTIDVAAGVFSDVVGNISATATQFNWTFEEPPLSLSQVRDMIYPNPANSIINIEIAGYQEATIYHLSGKKMLSSQEARMDISGLDEGIYLIIIKNLEGEVFTSKIVKE